MKSNNNQQKQDFLPSIKSTFSSSVDLGEGFDTINPSPDLCKYHESICPRNIPKYSMKCVFHKKGCNIRKYFDRYRLEDLGKLGIGGRK